MPAAREILNYTDQQIELIALATLRRVCLKQKDNRAVVKEEREAYAKLADKIGAIMDLRMQPGSEDAKRVSS